MRGIHITKAVWNAPTATEARQRKAKEACKGEMSMAKCSNCLNLQTSNFHWCELINDSPDINIERNCRYYKAMTNADFVRRMKDKDLAMVLMCPNENGLANIECDKNDNCNCYDCLLNWLKQKKQ